MNIATKLHNFKTGTAKSRKKTPFKYLFRMVLIYTPKIGVEVATNHYLHRKFGGGYVFGRKVQLTFHLSSLLI
jgi:hypothetical protein